MSRNRCRATSLIGALAVLALAALPAVADAAWLGFRNDTPYVLIVQGTSVVNNTVRQGKRHVLQPGEVGWDLITLPGNKLFVIADAKQPTRVLHQAIVPFAGPDQFFSIQVDQQGAAVKLKLTPAKPSTPPPETPQNSKR